MRSLLKPNHDKAPMSPRGPDRTTKVVAILAAVGVVLGIWLGVLVAADSSLPLSPSATDRAAEARQLLSGTAEPEELLPPDQAFPVAASVKDAETVEVWFTPARGYFLYRDKFEFAVEAPAGVAVKEATLPRGKIKDDPFFGRTEVFYGAVRAVLHLSGVKPKEHEVTLTLRYQGCNDPLGVCYPPIEKRVRLRLPGK